MLLNFSSLGPIYMVGVLRARNKTAILAQHNTSDNQTKVKIYCKENLKGCQDQATVVSLVISHEH